MRRPRRSEPDPRLPSAGSVPLRHLALIVVAVIAALGILTSVSFLIDDPDLWQHLLVGKVIWETRSVPMQHAWTWPSYGTPEVLPSWLFRALVWPFWSAGEVWGLFLWRWLTTLAVFGMLWMTARRLGARGFAPLVVLALCSLSYRERSQVRPETVAAVLLALQLLILEVRRYGGRDRTAWLLMSAWIWANAHISYFLGLVVIAVFWVDAWIGQARRGARSGLAATGGIEPRRLAVIALGALAVSFLNPFGWRALAQPFEYALFWRNEPIFQIIGELQPIDWSESLDNGLIPLMIGWPALLLWRARRLGLDRVEAGLCAIFTVLAFQGQRFLGFYVVAAAPYVARDLADALARLPRALPRPLRATVAALACVTVGLREWAEPELPLGVGFRPIWYPVAACDFIQDHGVRGRGFNDFELAGYVLYRFWPDQGRLPFMDIHQTGSARDRYAYAYSRADFRAWRELDDRHHFDYAILSRYGLRDKRLLDFVDADTSFALVFVDDVAALFVRRGGFLDPVAARFAYRDLSAGAGRLPELQRLCHEDSLACERVVEELRRAVAGSPQNSFARSLLANVALMRGDYAEGRRELHLGLEADPMLVRAHERLGLIELEEGRPRAALRHFRRERRLHGPLPDLDLRMGQAYRRLGDLRAAASWYRRELRRDPSHQEARDSLAAIGRAGI